MSGKIRNLETILQRVESWPEAARKELIDIVVEMEGQLSGAYKANPDELKAIDEADASGLASAEEVASAFRSFRK